MGNREGDSPSSRVESSGEIPMTHFPLTQSSPYSQDSRLSQIRVAVLSRLALRVVTEGKQLVTCVTRC
jgi:hypothetical protein